MNEYLDLFLTFLKIGSLTFGGGYAMLPVIQRELVDKKAWATNEEIVDYFALGQCVPGVIAVNTSTFIGYKRRGFWGAVAATFGMVFPSLVVILIIAVFLRQFSHISQVKSAFSGIRVAVAALVVNAVVKLWRTGVKGAFGIVIFLICLAVSLLLNISSITVVIVAAVVGILYNSALGRKKS